MSDIDLMNSLVTQAKSVPHSSGVSGKWMTPATAAAGSGFAVWVDPNAGYWTIYDGSAWPAESGQGSVLLGDALRRRGYGSVR
jgi:hypothetical protein